MPTSLDNLRDGHLYQKGSRIVLVPAGTLHHLDLSIPDARRPTVEASQARVAVG
jgi:hypothetical protein